MKTISHFTAAMMCVGALVGCGGELEQQPQRFVRGEQARSTGIARQQLTECETWTYDMRSPIQYTPPGGYTIQSVTGSGSWTADPTRTEYVDLTCPRLSDAVGYSSTYTKSFDSYYNDNSGSCTYTFCSSMASQCGQETVTFSPYQAMSYWVPYGAIQAVVFNSGSWNAYSPPNPNGGDPQPCRSLNNWVGSAHIAQEFDSAYSDNSGAGCTYTIYYGTGAYCAP
ncbi:hypothetical protein [Cystobacter fuscus]|nr:hypothetical protein [Cystobacter fuscus]